MDCRVVLLADDDVLVRNLVRQTLEEAGFRVFAAADGLEALALSNIYPGPIHVLVTDIDMPNLDGISLARQVQEHRPDTLIVMISGKASEPIHIRNKEVKLLSKPFETAALVRTIRDLLGDESVQFGRP